MITVAGFNTAIDRLLALNALEPGGVLRAAAASISPGGKGIHVAQTVAALGEQVQLVGLTDEAHRQLITQWLSAGGVDFHAVETAAPLRQCLALRELDGRITEVLEPGPQLDQSTRQKLLESLRRCASAGGLLVLTGSLPGGFAADTYASIARDMAVPVLLDASGDALRHAIAAGAYLVKINRDEASEWYGRPVDSLADALAVAKAMAAEGVVFPVVTLGAQGAVGLENGVGWHASLGLPEYRNPVGSGDCFLAGLAVSLWRGEGLAEALRLAAACGGANALNEETGRVQLADVLALLAQVRLQRLDG